MARGLKVPVGATCIAHVEGETSRDLGNPEGTTAKASLWRGHYSKGYKSDYERIETRWIYVEIFIPGEPVQRATYSYSGKRLAVCEREWNSVLEGLGLTVAA